MCKQQTEWLLRLIWPLKGLATQPVPVQTQEKKILLDTSPLLGLLAIQFKVATAPGSRWSTIWESLKPSSQLLPPSQPSCAVVPRSRWSLGLCRCRRVTQVTLLPAVHFLEQAFAGADFSTEKFSAALSLISAALFQCPKIAKFSVAHFFKLSCDLRCSFSIAKSRKILRCSSSDIWKGSKLSCREY